MHDIGLIVLTGVSLLLLLLIVRVHWRARNVGTLLNIFWLFLGNLVYLVNAIVWWDNVENSAPVWCDISTKMQNAFIGGLTASTLCINKRLADIAASRVVTTDQRRKRITLAVDLGLGLGLPVLCVILAYIVTPHRYNILEGYGCDAVVYSTIPTIFLVYCPPLIISCVSAGYGVTAGYAFLKRRLEFNAILKQSKSALDRSHYIRLIALSSTDLIISIPLTLYLLILAATSPLEPWISWDNVHYGWSYVGLTPASTYLRTGANVAAFSLHRYLYPLLTFIFFLFFGVSDEAVNDYLRMFKTTRKLMTRGRKPTASLSFVPKLGSSVVQSAPIWGDEIIKEGVEPESASLSPIFAKNGPGQQNLAVTVQVDREIV
uniref:Ste3 n=1 Tax=Tremella mesenterica TaxID=5217 RepID=E2I8I6_TREME|nr:Ste3 [Tremella mesenterica]